MLAWVASGFTCVWAMAEPVGSAAARWGLLGAGHRADRLSNGSFPSPSMPGVFSAQEMPVLLTARCSDEDELSASSTETQTNGKAKKWTDNMALKCFKWHVTYLMKGKNGQLMHNMMFLFLQLCVPGGSHLGHQILSLCAVTRGHKTLVMVIFRHRTTGFWERIDDTVWDTMVSWLKVMDVNWGSRVNI